MKKIPSLFARDGAVLTRDYNPAAIWVYSGEGVATRKYDGTACRVADGQLWARYDAKRGKAPPVGFVSCQDPDPITGHHPGWVPATRPEDKWIREAFGPDLSQWPDWTYEACGPRIGGNREGMSSHVAVPHGHGERFENAPTEYDALVRFFTERPDIEGIVWWRNIDDVDCDKVKITGAALGVPRRKFTAVFP